MHATFSSSSTYGEITPKGFRGLAERIELCPDDSFVDLGSGVGRTVCHAVLEFGCRRSRGVEMAPSRHERAQRAVNELIGKRESLHQLMMQVCLHADGGPLCVLAKC
jgi:cyclopropane fatty-acyl-phospholipid synthase-like methyltransferase